MHSTFSALILRVTWTLLAIATILALPALAWRANAPPLFTHILAAGALLSLLMLAFHRPVLRALTTLPDAKRHTNLLERYSTWLGLLAAAAGLSYLEWRQPLYFTRDDNHSQILPVIIGMMRLFLETGSLPTWNGYQAFGAPLTIGGYAFTYPPLYLAYGLARLAGNELLTIEIFAWMHLLAGYWIFARALRILNVRPSIAAIAALAFIFNGAVLMLGRSWYWVLFFPLWHAVLLWLLALFIRDGIITLRWAVMAGLTLGIYFQMGHAEFWLYSAVLWSFAIGLCLMTYRHVRSFGYAFVAMLIALALMLPLLLIQYEAQQSIGPARCFGCGTGILQQLPELLIPASHLQHRSNAAPALYGSGVMMVCFMLASLFGLMRLALPDKNAAWWRLQSLWLCGLISLLWALGNQGPIWPLLTQIEPFSKFRWPFKFAPYAWFFICASAAVFLESLMRTGKGGRVIGYALALASLLLSIDVIRAVPPARWSPPDYAYPPLSGRVEELTLKNSYPYRALIVGTDRSMARGFTARLPVNYGSYYGVITTAKYRQRASETLEFLTVAERANASPEAFMQAYGIGHCIQQLYRGGDFDFEPQEITIDCGALARRDQRRIHEVETAAGYRLFDFRHTSPRPLVSRNDAPLTPIPFTLRPNGLRFTLPSVQKGTAFNDVTLAFAMREHMGAYAQDGNPLTVHTDDWGRIVIEQAPMGQEITLRYQPYTLTHMLYALTLLALAGLVAWLLRPPARKP